MLFEIKQGLDRIAYPIYRARGSRPWGPGYFTAKRKAICAGIDQAVMADGKQLQPGYGCRIDERVVEYPWVYAQLPARPGLVLDAGSALNYDFLLERAPICDASLSIMTLAPEKRCYWRRAISYQFGDLRDTWFSDGSFDAIISVSTIEHIGLDNTMLYTGDVSKNESDNMGFVPAVAEFKRILRQGGLCLITVPFGRPGVHGWYQVFDQQLVDTVVDTFDPSAHQVDYFGYIDDGWQRVEAAAIEQAEFFDVHEGKPFAPDYAAGARGVACIRLIA